MSTAFVNARSIVNKFDEFEVFVHNEEPDITGVSETWLHEDAYPIARASSRATACTEAIVRTGEEDMMPALYQGNHQDETGGN